MAAQNRPRQKSSVAEIKKYCFHHIPKTAGSSLQLRLAHREWAGELPQGSTLVVYPFKGDTRFYRVAEDPDFDPDQTIRTAFERTYNRPRTTGSSSIVMGHLTTRSQAGKHYTWLRDPLARDVSHFNYDMRSGNTTSTNFYEHIQNMAGNFQVLWLYGRYLGLNDSPPIEQKYRRVADELRRRVTVYDNDRFEQSWDEICKELDLSPEPRLNSNEGGSDYTIHVRREDLTLRFVQWHRSHNHYDYLLYEEFCSN
jgi:hypothetical protein